MTRTARRSLGTAAAAVAAVALPLTGCATPFGGDEPTSSPATPEASPSRPPSSTPTGEDAGRQLTMDEAKAALPPRPPGTQRTPEPPKSTRRTTDPAVCIDVLRIGDEAGRVKKTQVLLADRSWLVKGTTVGEQYDVSIRSHSRPVGPALLDRAGAVMGDCDAFAFTGRTGGESFDNRVFTEPRTTPDLGDQGFAVRFTTPEMINGKSKRLYLDHLDVRVGHNLVEVTHTHWDETNDFSELESYARDILGKLQERS